MIPKAAITAWRKTAPWGEDWQVEQDLILSRALVDADLLLEAFDGYMTFGGTPVTRAQFEANMAAKITDAPFVTDVPPLLRTGIDHEPAEAWSRVHAALVSRLPGDPWKGAGDAE